MQRRKFIQSGIGTIVAAGAAPPTMASSASPRASWDAAMAHWQSACRAYTEFEATTLATAEARYYGWFAAQGWTDLPHSAPYSDRQENNARRRLMAKRCPYYREYEAAHDENQRLVDVESDAHSALMAMPAPDRAALRWKLDYILDASGTASTDSYSVEFVAQTVADYRRLLGDA